MSDPTFPAYPILTGVGLLLVLVPFPWHFRASNAGTCLYMLWSAVASLTGVVNSILWHGNTDDKAPAWCEISVHLSLSMMTAIPASALCITRRLYIITNLSTVEFTRRQRRRAVAIDLLIGLALPVLQIPLQYVVQSRRYDIYEDIGCQPAIVNTILTYPLVILWPAVLSIISACYCAFTLYMFISRRSEFNKCINKHLLSPTSSLGQYLRLTALASTQFFISLPTSFYTLYLWLMQPGVIIPYESWAYIHTGFSHVQQVPASVWRYDRNVEIAIELARWSIPFSSVAFFLFFGLSDEARKQYKMLFGKMFDACRPGRSVGSPRRPQRWSQCVPRFEAY
ncbi:STE3-like pheromone receptor [Gloeophyllum trabeum ATCC 11539]|uniref:STE3-like pheromone receptor n=1 Tax=Gloeophyllum trabeum (strain ATCC 11539 / FP-39264 / Madison 617) TaxID=670483 RepID=S7RME8_GLOTA|nr:STE3-like pheromone receptor [Gloeophyllum trabeum ATCC 11539]EPQ55605.1 STE3-like pheromone receptor [Gloeophyllum trabeum ATCC 11539]